MLTGSRSWLIRASTASAVSKAGGLATSSRSAQRFARVIKNGTPPSRVPLMVQVPFARPLPHLVEHVVVAGPDPVELRPQRGIRDRHLGATGPALLGVVVGDRSRDRCGGWRRAQVGPDAGQPVLIDRAERGPDLGQLERSERLVLDDGQRRRVVRPIGDRAEIVEGMAPRHRLVATDRRRGTDPGGREVTVGQRRGEVPARHGLEPTEPPRRGPLRLLPACTRTFSPALSASDCSRFNRSGRAH